MARRRASNITNIRGTGPADATVVWRLLECATPGCDHLHRVSEEADGFPDIELECSKCGHTTRKAHIERATRWKYCRVCEWLQPIGVTVSRAGSVRGKTVGSAFHYHKPNSRAFRSERQLECKECKREINRVIRANVDAFIAGWIDHPRDVTRVRELIIEKEGVDIKDDAAIWPSFLD